MTSRKTRKYVAASGPDVDLERDVVRDSRGRRITEEYAQRAVEETHRQLGRGRPSLTGHASRSPQVTFRLPPELKDKAEELAAREGKRVSDVARDALRDYLARRKVS
jgi:hypothetical protein